MITTLRQIVCIVTHDSGRLPVPEIMALSNSLPIDVAAFVAAVCGRPMEIPPGLELTDEILEANPEAVHDYMPRYELRYMTTPAGYEVTAVSRTVYLGRLSVTHILIADGHDTGTAIFAAIDRHNLWYPADYTPRHGNKALTDLMSGTLSGLPDCELDVAPLPISAICQSHELLSALPMIVRGGGEATLHVDPEQVPALLVALGALPEGLFDHMDVYASIAGTSDAHQPGRHSLRVIADGAVPDQTHAGVFATRLVRLLEEKDYLTATALMRWGVSAADDPSVDLGTILFLASDTPTQIEPGELTKEFISYAAEKVKDSDRLHRVASKAMACLSDEITVATKARDLRRALERAGAVIDLMGNGGGLSDEAARRLSRLLFAKGSASYLHMVADARTARTIAALIPRDMMGDTAAFVQSLATSGDPEVWCSLATRYWDGSPAHEDAPALLSAIAAAPRLTDAAGRSRVAMMLLPLAVYAKEIVLWAREHPDQIPSLQPLVHALCASSRRECFSAIVGSTVLPDESSACLTAEAEAYFGSRIAENPDTAGAQLLRMAEVMGPRAFGRIGGPALLGRWVDAVFVSPTAESGRMAREVEACGVPLGSDIMERAHMVHTVMAGAIPDGVTMEMLLLAHRVPEPNPRYIVMLFGGWMAEGPDIDIFEDYLGKARLTDPDMIEDMVGAVWRCKSRTVAGDRERYVESIIRLTGWESDDITEYASETSDKELSALLKKKNTVMSKLRRVFRR